MNSIDISIVSPVFNEEESIEVFLDELVSVMDSTRLSFEIIFAVDPCTDSTVSILTNRISSDPRIKMLEFSRKFGQPAATMAGIEHSNGRAVVVMDCDMQDPPSLIPLFVEKWNEGYEVVYAQRLNRDGETWFKKFSTKYGYLFINKFAEVNIPRNTGDFRLMDRVIVDHLKNFPESHSFLRGLVALIGYRQTAVTFDRPARVAGSGKYNRFIGNLRFQFNGIIAFSTVLLNLSTVLGFLSAIASIGLGIAYTFMKLLGVPFPVGNPTIVILLLFVGGAQLTCLGIIGQYIGRIYDDVKRRPRYIVRSKTGF